MGVQIPELVRADCRIRLNFSTTIKLFNKSKIQRVNQQLNKMTKTCPRCGKTFECVHSVDCWCVKVKLADATKAYLKANYSDCLCKDCLEEINGK